MASIRFPVLMRLAYEEAAQEYLRSLPPEHFMEATAQATQRKITLESLDLVKARRPEVQVFNELLVLYQRPGQEKPAGVVPDNMIVIHPEPLRTESSYHAPLEPPPLVVLEYVSKSNSRKDYDDNMVRYERELKVPYYLLFYPDSQDLTLYHHNKRKYVSVKPNKAGRLAIPELELEVALLDGWVRYWFRGKLLPLPADLQHSLDETERKLDETARKLDATERKLDATARKLNDKQSQLDREREAREAVEAELKQLREELTRTRKGPNGKL